MRRQSLTGSVLDVLELEAAEQKAIEERRARRLWLILPHSRFLQSWLLIIGPLIVYNVIWIPLEVCQMATASQLHAQVDFVLDFLFYIDILINFRTAFFDAENALCLDSKVIAKRYLFGFFLVDFVSTIQWELYIFGATPYGDASKSNQFSIAISVLRLTRLLRLLRLFKKLDVYPSLKMAKLAFLFLLVSHWVGCGWFLMGYLAIQMHRSESGEAVSPLGSLALHEAFNGFPQAATSVSLHSPSHLHFSRVRFTTKGIRPRATTELWGLLATTLVWANGLEKWTI